MTAASNHGLKLSLSSPQASSSALVMTSSFDLPEDIVDDDRVLLHNVLTAMQAGSLCKEYKVDVIATGFLVRGTLSCDVFEVDSDDLFFLTSVSPLRIERVAVARSSGCNELVVKVLDCKQRVMVSGAATFTAIKKRRIASAGCPP